MPPSHPDFSVLLEDDDDLPTGVTNVLGQARPEHRPVLEAIYREHRWNHRILRQLSQTLGAIKLLMWLTPVATGAVVAVIEGAQYVLAHWKP